MASLFDQNQQYNTVLPSPKRKPVEDINTTLDTLNTASALNKTQYNTQLNAYNIYSHDPVAQKVIEEKRDAFLNRTRDMVEKGNYAYMGRNLQNEANTFIQDRYLQNANRDTKEYEAHMTKVGEDATIDPLHREAYVKNTKYNLEAKPDSPVYTPYSLRATTPFKKVDVNTQLVNIAKALDPSGDTTTSATFLNSDGKTTTDISKAAANIFKKYTSGSESVTKDELSMVMEAALENDSNMLGYLAQNYYINNADKYKGKDFMVAVNDIVTGKDKEARAEVIKNATDELATAMEYKKSVHVTDWDNLNLGIGDSNKNTQPNNDYTTLQSGTIKTPIVDSKDLTTKRQNSTIANATNINTQILSGKGNVNEISDAISALKEGDNSKLSSLITKHNLSAGLASNLISMAKTAIVEEDVLYQKQNNVVKDVYNDENTPAELKPLINFDKNSSNPEVLKILGYLGNLEIKNIQVLRDRYKAASDIENVKLFVDEINDGNKLVEGFKGTSFGRSTASILYTIGITDSPDIIPKQLNENIQGLKEIINSHNGVAGLGIGGDIKTINKTINKKLEENSSNTLSYEIISNPNFGNIATTKEQVDQLETAAFNYRNNVTLNKDLSELSKEDKELLNTAFKDQIKFRSIIPGNIVDGESPGLLFTFEQPASGYKIDKKQIEFIIPAGPKGINTEGLDLYRGTSDYEATSILNTPLKVGSKSYYNSEYNYNIDYKDKTNPIITRYGQDGKPYPMSKEEGRKSLAAAIDIKKYDLKNKFGNITLSPNEIADAIIKSKNNNIIDDRLKPYYIFLNNNDTYDARSLAKLAEILKQL